MADTRVPFWPPPTDCLAWSADCELAIPGPDCVQVLIPTSLPTFGLLQIGQRPDHPLWHAIRLNIDVPTPSDLNSDATVQDPLDRIGHNQSPVIVAAVSWSPSGLVQHERSLLAILATNQVLSLWSNEADPKHAPSWQCSLNVNTIIKTHFHPTQSDKTTVVPVDSSERWRIRAFAWDRARTASLSWERTGKTSTLAVATEANMILLLEVVSAHFLLSSTEPARRVQILSTISIGPSLPRQPVPVETPQMLFKRPVTYADMLSWSPWLLPNEELSAAMLAYTHNGRLCIRTLILPRPGSADRKKGDEAFCYVSDEQDFSKEIGTRVDRFIWCDEVLHGRLHLLVVHDGSVTTMAFEARHLRASEVSARDLEADQRPDPPTLEKKQLFADVTDDWSPITGMVTTRDTQREIVYLHLTSHLGQVESLKYHLDASSISQQNWTASAQFPANSPVGQEGSSISATLKDRLKWHLARFSSDKNLMHTGVSKIMGLAASPAKDQVAFAFTLHPSNMIEYVAPVHEFTPIVFASEGSTLTAQRLEELVESDWDGISTEAQLLILRTKVRSKEAAMLYEYKWPEITLDDITSVQLIDEDVDTISICNEAYARGYGTFEANRLRRRHLIKLFAFCNEHKRIQRDEEDRIISAVAADQQLLQLQITSILTLPRSRHVGSRLSRKMLYAAASIGSLFFTHIKALLELCASTFSWIQETYDFDMSNEFGWCERTGKDEVAKRDLGGILAALRASTSDQCVEEFHQVCEVCDELVGWADPITSTCSRGHVFHRCLMTFLTIQAPGISRSCGICGVQYLKEGILSNDELTTSDGDGDTRASAPISSARIILATCGRCIQCGGKLIG